MNIDNGKKICFLLLIISFLVTYSVKAQTQEFTFDSLTTFSAEYDDFLMNQPIQIWFNDVLDFFTLDPNTSFESLLSDSLLLRYTIGNHYFTIESFYGNFKPLDNISVTLGADIASGRGVPLGASHTFDIKIGPVVYPGDTDNNGIVDERDILPLGIFWQDTGPMRPDGASLIWGMKPTYRWDVVRATYADADGNGIVEAHDICGISDNFGRTQIVFTPENNKDYLTLLKQTSPDFAAQIYAALVDCSNKGAGKQALLDALEPIVNRVSEAPLPKEIVLNQNYPNPFNPNTTIEFFLPEGTYVTISVFNVTGQVIKTLINKTMPRGFSQVVWDGTDYNNNPVSSGIYFYRLNTEDMSIVKRMLLLK